MHSGADITFKDLILIGGGHAHAHVLKMFGMNPITGVRVTLISRDVDSPYSGMIPGHYTRDECHLDLRQMCSFGSIRFIRAEVCGLDTTKKLIFLNGGRPPITYDIVSINIGITPKLDLSSLSNAAHSVITPVKPIDGFAVRFEDLLTRVRASTGIFRVAVVGGGAGGCELCLTMNHRFRNELLAQGKDPTWCRLTLYNRGAEIMTSHSKNVRSIMQRIMRERGIEVELSADIVGTELDGDGVTNMLQCADGRLFPFDEAIWCTQAAPQSWLQETGLDLDEDGFINVKQTLECVNTPGVFAVGDVCSIENHPRPKAGVFAVRAGPPLVQNLRRSLLNQLPLEEWEPQDQFLGLIGTGDAYAVASRGPLALEGEYLWTLKDHIDRVWMSGYVNLRQGDMAARNGEDALGQDDVAGIMGQAAIDVLVHSKMRCGGCGSKVGAQVLDRALRRIKHLVPTRREVVAGLGVSAGDDAALVRPPVSESGANMLLVHTLDYFRSFVSDPYMFGRIAAVHALSDIHAMNADPVTALALCVLPYGPEDKVLRAFLPSAYNTRPVEESLVQMLAGMCSMLREENCALIGGHTSEGADAALGLSVNGVVEEGKELRKGPPQDGDVLILTKGIGTGTIMAADMRAAAKGRWVEGALASMTQSNREGAKILHSFGCSGCTDVTGFGVMGHLLEMMKHGDSTANSIADDDVCKLHPSEADVALELSMQLRDVPLLDGAQECVRDGVLSSLHPQTSGGLLASVRASSGEEAVMALRAAGYHKAAIIGSFRAVRSLGPTVRMTVHGGEAYMTDILKAFDDCIEDLVGEIEGIENGDFDHDLDGVVAYSIKPQYDTIIGKYCSFPPPPSLNDTDDVGDTESVDTHTPVSSSHKQSIDDDASSESRRTGRHGKKRKANALDTPGESVTDTGDEVMDPSPTKPPSSASKTPSRRSSRARG